MVVGSDDFSGFGVDFAFVLSLDFDVLGVYGLGFVLLGFENLVVFC